MRQDLVGQLFRPVDLERLRNAADVDTDAILSDFETAPAEILSATEILLSGWGSPALTEPMLDRMPRLKAIVHCAGTVKKLVPRSVWERGIRVTSTAQSNALPVAEFTLAMILLSGKRAIWAEREFSRTGVWQPPSASIGNFGSTVGIVGASRIGQLVIRLLQGLDMTVLVYDPFASQEECTRWGAEKVELAELARRSSTISIHAPLLPATVGLISRDLLAMLPDGATVINTARGAILDQDALLAELDAHRLYAALDVTEPEPLPAGHPLLTHPRAFVTPHVAGAQGNEIARLGSLAVDEIERFVSSGTFDFEILVEDLDRIA